MAYFINNIYRDTESERPASDKYKPSNQIRHTGIRPPYAGSQILNQNVDEYAFLIGKGIGRDRLVQAAILAQKWDVPVHQVLVSLGWLTSQAYYQSLAEYCRVEFLPKQLWRKLDARTDILSPDECLDLKAMAYRTNGSIGVALAPAREKPSSLFAAMTILAKDRNRVAIAAPETFQAAIIRRASHFFIDRAVTCLEKIAPGFSARTGLVSRQKTALIVSIIIVICLGITDINSAATIVGGLLSVMFLALATIRFIACMLAIQSGQQSASDSLPEPDNLSNTDNLPRTHTLKELSEKSLPVYTILVPLFREKKILPQLIRAIQALDYPAAKLDIKLIFEECDQESVQYIHGLTLPGNMDIIVVPDTSPRTKPKALNYALQFARGEFVVIYDAEDIPQTDQLKKAVFEFSQAPEKCVCLQAKLSFYNGQDNWLSKQFFIEYTALFHGLLPALEKMNLPIPLGGTSNHFRMKALKELGAWDAYNVTEDADLGIRLYRQGLTAKVLDSTTHEEACCLLNNWFHQRTRWLKGWMMTYLVHMRSPGKLWKSLGAKGFLGFQAIIGGLIISALIQPFFFALVLLDLLQGVVLIVPETLFGIPFWLIALFNLSFGYISSMVLAGAILINRKNRKYLSQIIFIPLYWMLISAAAFSAVYRLIRAPFYWEKTEHGLNLFASNYKNVRN